MQKVAQIWGRIQGALFPHLEQALDEPLTEKQRQLVAVLEVVRIEEHVPPGCLQWMGRKRKDRRVLARAFVAKAVYDLPTTEVLIEALRDSNNLLPRDASLAPLEDSAIPVARANEILSRSRAQRQVVIYDCCHSGGFVCMGASGQPRG